MIKRAMAIALVLALALMLGGCRLAMDEDNGKGDDLFVGVSLRVEDWGEPTGWDEEGFPYWDAPEEETVDLTPEEAALFLRGEFPTSLFSNEQPIGPYAYYLVQRKENGEIYNETVNTWPGSAQAHISVTDEGEEYTVTLKIYVCGEAVSRYETDYFDVIMHVDDIYQRPDGSLYCLQDRAGVSGHIDGFLQTIRQELNATDLHGETSSYAMEISTEFVLVPELKEANVLAFDAVHNLLETMPIVPVATEFGYDDCEILPPTDTAYLILEEKAVDEEGNVVVTRSVADMPSSEYEWSNALFTIYVPAEDHLAIPCYVRLLEEA